MIEKQLLIQIGLKIKQLRKDKGISQIDLADLCDFEKSNMARIEAGKTNLTVRTLLKISIALKVSIVDLLSTQTEIKKNGHKNCSHGRENILS